MSIYVETKQKIGDNELLDPFTLAKVITDQVFDGYPNVLEAGSGKHVADGMNYVVKSLDGLILGSRGFSPWVNDMFLAMQHDTRIIKAILHHVLMHQIAESESLDKSFNSFAAEISEAFTGGLIPRLETYLGRFHPLNQMARRMTHRIYREHMEYVPAHVRDAKVLWEVYHTPTGLIIEDFGLDSEQEAIEFINQYPTIDDMNREGEDDV